MMMLRLFVACAVVACTRATVSSLRSGNWGFLAFTTNPSKCYGEAIMRKNQQNHLITVICNPDINHDTDTMLWRYDANTQELQNKGISEEKGKPYCLAAEELRANKYIYLAPCKGGKFTQFALRDEHGGNVQQLILKADTRLCVDFWSTTVYSSRTYNAWGALVNCNSVTSYRTEQWTNFIFHSRYRGNNLQPVRDPNIADGNWGFYKVLQTGSCWSVDSITLKLEQRYCNDQDDGQRFQYLAASREIRNWRYPRTGGGKGCLTRTGSSFYVTRCTGSTEQKFLVRDGQIYTGTYQQIVVFNDQRKCLYVSGSGGGHKNIYYTTCQQTMTASSDQWLEFVWWKSGVDCPAGRIPDGATCKPCSAGTYNPQRGAKTCLPCPAGRSSTPGSASCQLFCSAGKYMDVSGRCKLCPMNTYTHVSGRASCTQCPAGTHTKKKGSTRCIADATCPAGSYINAHNKCWKCPKDTYSNRVNSQTCIKCPDGSHTTTTGSTRCIADATCPAGSYINAHNKCWKCPKDTYSNRVNSHTCIKCPDGSHTTTTGSTRCIADATCPAGSYINAHNKCWKCPKDTYSNRVNSHTCIKCPDGSHTTATGATQCTSKTFCGPGRFHNGRICQKCPRNTYDNSVGNTSCKKCPAGFETKRTGATRCTRKNNCAAGSFFYERENKCQPCPRNTYTDVPHQVTCKKCPEGTGTKAEGATNCIKINYCKAGKYHDGEKCTDCPVNTYSDEPGAWDCTPCPHAHITDGAGSVACRRVKNTDCGPGKYFNSKVCLLCPKNKYSDERGKRYCKNCPAGTETETTGATKCKKKEVITVKAVSAARHVQCSTNKACIMRCRFSTSTGIKITNKSNVEFYKLVGSSWNPIAGPTAYNRQTDWFSEQAETAGVYKCSATYGSATGTAWIEVGFTSQLEQE